ncbi:MAG: SRPBCC family protein [Proteobacteria bacterium]|nr:SRPBCC family protein [Pseudomonadota bacterium]
MSSLRIEERFPVAAPPEQVFAFLLDPERIVACMPGAALDEVESERVFLGSVRVKLGAVTLVYKGRLELSEVDDAGHRVRAVGEGREKGGAGKVKLRLDARVDGDGAGGSQVTVEAEVELAGRIVRFGRGMIESVAKQLFGAFAEAVRARLGAAAETGAGTEPAAAPSAANNDAAPIRGLPLLLRALWDALVRLFQR